MLEIVIRVLLEQSHGGDKSF